MLFRQLIEPETSTYTYLLADSESREAVIIDPVDTKLDRDIKLIEELGLKPLFVFDTHVHADHITSLGPLADHFSCQTGLSVHSGTDCADLKLKQDDEYCFGRHALQVIETPGHTNGCLSFLCEGMVFTGDALMIRACGRTDFQQGSPARLYESLTEKLFTLPDETLVYPGHDYKGMTVTTIGEEKRLNPRATLDRDAFIELMNHLNLPMPKRIDEAVPANLRCGRAD